MRDKILGGLSFSPHRYFNMSSRIQHSEKFTCFDKLSGLKYTRLTFNKTKYDDVPAELAIIDYKQNTSSAT